jgi:acyl-CoA thioester hydrolase
MNETTFHHRLPIQLRWSDADAFGHVNNAAYFQYYDTAKIDYVRSVCPPMGDGFAIVVVHLEADFLSQVFTTDHVEVQTAVTAIGHKSFTLMQQLVRTDTGQVMCQGHTVMVTFDRKSNQAIPVPDSWVEAMCRYEGRDLRKEAAPKAPDHRPEPHDEHPETTSDKD